MWLVGEVEAGKPVAYRGVRGESLCVFEYALCPPMALKYSYVAYNAAVVVSHALWPMEMVVRSSAHALGIVP